MALPEMTPEQRAAALEKAAAARTARKQLKGRLKSGEVTLAGALGEDAAARMKVAALLTALPGVGKVRAAQVMKAHGIAENRRAGSLSPEKRAALAEAFAALSA